MFNSIFSKIDWYETSKYRILQVRAAAMRVQSMLCPHPQLLIINTLLFTVQNVIGHYPKSMTHAQQLATFAYRNKIRVQKLLELRLEKLFRRFPNISRRLRSACVLSHDSIREYRTY